MVTLTYCFKYSVLKYQLEIDAIILMFGPIKFYNANKPWVNK